MTSPGSQLTALSAGECLLTRSPFWTLKVSVRSTASEIVEAASDPLLALDPEEISRARLVLVTPRSRVACEVGWLPGVSPGRARQLVEQLLKAPQDVVAETGLPATAAASVTYRIAIGAGPQLAEITLSNSKVFGEAVSRLWKIAGFRLATKMLQHLSRGGDIKIGGISFNDESVVLFNPRVSAKRLIQNFFSLTTPAWEHETVPWAATKVYDRDGQFVVCAQADARLQASASYQAADNTHVLANVVRAAFDKGHTHLSALLAS